MGLLSHGRKDDRHFFQKRTRSAEALEVIPHKEPEFVDPGSKVFVGQQGAITAAVFIGGEVSQQLTVAAESDAHSCGGLSVAGIENVG